MSKSSSLRQAVKDSKGSFDEREFKVVCPRCDGEPFLHSNVMRDAFFI